MLKEIAKWGKKSRLLDLSEHLNFKTPYFFKTNILVQNDRHCVMFQLECRHLLETENRSRTSDHECGEFVRPKPPAVPLFSD